MQIDLSGLDRFVPKPKGDDAGVDPSLEELNGGGVAQDVGGYVFVDESRALLASGGGVLFDEPFDGVAAQDAAATAGKQRLSWSCTLLLNPVSENRDCLRSERRRTLLTALASTADVSNRFKRDIFALQLDELRDTKSGLDHREQERMVSASDPTVSIGSFE